MESLRTGRAHTFNRSQRARATTNFQMSTHTPRERLATLTTAERRIIELIADGLSAKSIADLLGLSHRTVDNHRTNLMRKLNVHKSVELVRIVVEVQLGDRMADALRDSARLDALEAVPCGIELIARHDVKKTPGMPTLRSQIDGFLTMQKIKGKVA